MPVFYVVMIAAVALTAFFSRPERATPGRSTALPPRIAEPPVKVPDPSSVAGPRDRPPGGPEDIERTEEGLRRKVLVESLDLIPRIAPGLGGAASSSPLDYFSIHFVFDETQSDGDRWLQIGPRDGPPIGWVRAPDVLEWDTRLLARPTPRDHRPPLVIYRDRACLVRAIQGEPCPDHPDACPLEGEESATNADATPASASSPPVAGLPILRSETVPGSDGSPSTIFEVVSLVADHAPVRPPDEPPADLIPDLNRVYVAFAIDTTASMRASIDAARAMADRLVVEAGRRHAGVALRLGLVEYRDEAPSVYGYRTRIVAPFTDAASFRRALDRLEPAPGGDGSVEERVLDGVASALPRPPGEPIGAVHHLDWPTGRAGQLATKLLIVLGDAPDHDRDLRRTRELATQAREAGITIAAVSIERADRSRDEATRYRDQWQTLAEGAYRPLDPTRSYEAPIEPLRPILGGEDALAAVLQVLIDDRIEAAKALAALAAAEAEARLEEYVTAAGLTLDQVHPVLVDLHRGEPTPVARPDPRHGGRKAPSVRRGWVAERVRDQPLVTVEVLLTRDELEDIVEELAALQQVAQGTMADLGELLRIGTAVAAGEASFLAADRGTLTFAEHLSRRRGLPPPGPESLLRQSQADLLQADAPTRAALVQRLGDALAALIELRNAPDWSDPRRTLSGMASIPYHVLDF